MDELPLHAKRLLALARDCDEPTDAARDRVRCGVALAVGAGTVAAAGAATSSASASSAASVGAKIGLGSSAAVKLALAGTVTVALGAAAWGLRPAAVVHKRPTAAVHTSALPHAEVRTTSAPARPALQEPQLAVQSPAATPDEDRAPAEKRAQPRLHPKSGPHRSIEAERALPAQSLRAEMTILYEASSALDRGDLVRARDLLNTHRAQHASGQLRVERRGLEVLTRCMAGEADAVETARAYLRAVPDGVLAARIATACKLERTP